MFDITNYVSKLQPAQGKGRYYCPNCGGNDFTIGDSGAYSCWHGCTPSEIRSSLGVKRDVFTGLMKKEGNNMIRINPRIEGSRKASFPFRGLDYKYLDKYGITFSKSDRGYLAYLPYFAKDNNEFADYKVSNISTKDIFWRGTFVDGKRHTNAKHVGFFGEHLVTRKTLLITEGEWDAVAAAFMLDNNISCVSIPFGAKSAASYIKSRLEWVEKFQKVYICFDEDEPGREAAEAVMALLKPGIGYRMHLRYKDANAYLQRAYEPKAKRFNKQLLEEAIKDFKEAWWAAKPIQPEYVFQDWDSILSMVNGTDLDTIGVSSGIPQLDKIIGGLRKEEVTTLFADPAEGKSSLSRHIIAHRLMEGDKVLMVSLEEPIKKAVMEVFCHLFKKNVFPKDGVPQLTGEELGRAKKYFREQMILVDLTCNQNVDKVKEVLEYGVRIHDADLIVYDNVTAGVAGDEKTHQSIDKLYSVLQAIAKQYSVHVLAISHTKRRENNKRPPMMTDGYGSGGIERFSNTVITLHQSIIRVVKNRNTGDKGQFRIYWDAVNRCFIDLEGQFDDNTRKEESSTNTGGVLRQPIGSPGSSGLCEQVGSDTEPDDPANSDRDMGSDNEPGLEDSRSEENDLRGAEGGERGPDVVPEHKGAVEATARFHRKFKVSGTFPEPHITPPNQDDFWRISHEVRCGMGVFTDEQRKYFRRAYLSRNS